MRRLLILIIIACSCLSLQSKNLKVLAIGNSFSEDAIEQNLWELAATGGDTLIIGVMYIGGSPLEAHFNNFVSNADAYSYRKIVNGKKTITERVKLIPAIRDEKWDVITFQQVSQLSGKYDSYFPFLPKLIALTKEQATNPNVLFGFHATWAYAQNSTHAGFVNYEKDQMQMFNAIVVAVNQAARDASIDLVIPAGTAIQNGRTSFIGDAFCRDGYHLDYKFGRYTAACTWYEALLGKSVVGNTYVPEGVTPEQAEIAQNAAHYAVENPLVVTAMDK